MAEEKRGWKQFQNLSFDSRKISKRVKKAEGATMRHARKFIVTRLDNIRSVRRHIIGWLLLVGFLILAVWIQFVWFRSSYETTAAAAGGAYAEAALGPVDTLNPLYASSSAELAASRLLFSSLYTYDTTGHLHGDLAERMDIDKSGTIYTIMLRSNARWHDGALLTAKDVEYTVNLIKNPETRSPLRVNWQDVKVKALNETTVQFQLPAIYAAFPNALTFAVLPEHLLSNVAPGAIRENTYSRAPVGSGPFSLRLLQNTGSGSLQKIVHMNSVDSYYGGKPFVNRFEIHAYDTQESIVHALRGGEVTAATDMSGVSDGQIDKHNYNIINKPIDSGVYALFNTDSPILKDKAVRQALELATNTNEILKKQPTRVTKLELPFIDTQVSGDITRPLPTDVKRAGELLNQAGWEMKNGVRQKGDQKLALNVATTKNGQYEKALETLAGQWRKIGVVVNTNVVNPSDPSINFVQNILQTRNYDVLLYELFIGADPDVYAYWHSSQATPSGYNFANYRNKAADDALASARSRLEPELRSVKYRLFAKQWVDDVPAIALYQSNAEYVVNKHAHSIGDDSTFVSAFDRFDNILDWSVNQKSVYKTP